jgi:hypothetical protein
MNAKERKKKQQVLVTLQKLARALEMVDAGSDAVVTYCGIHLFQDGDCSGCPLNAKHLCWRTRGTAQRRLEQAGTRAYDAIDPLDTLIKAVKADLANG